MSSRIPEQARTGDSLDFEASTPNLSMLLSNKARFKEHIRPRRQFQCSCGKVIREEKFKDHLSRCDGGSELFVCWRPNNGHRHEFSTREDIIAHYTSCPRRKRGRPRKARTEGRSNLRLTSIHDFHHHHHLYLVSFIVQCAAPSIHYYCHQLIF
ncbi:hypothetical protein AUP68_14252 [Ilyonectria robusta]